MHRVCHSPPHSPMLPVTSLLCDCLLFELPQLRAVFPRKVPLLLPDRLPVVLPTY
jgi:hypothetical protein